jgi:TonB family protein
MERRASFASEETERHEQAVKRFRSLCDMHRVSCGGAEDLRGFEEHLNENRHLAMDFWAFVGDLSSRERGTLSDDEMLGVIVEGVSGHSVEDLPASSAEFAGRMRQMLAGVDVGGLVLPDLIAEPEDALLSAKRISMAKQPEVSADRTHTQRMIADALTKLEETARELREHLAAIEREKASRAALPQEPPEPPELKPEVVVLREEPTPALEREQPESERSPTEPVPSSRTAPEAIRPLVSYIESAAGESASKPGDDNATKPASPPTAAPAQVPAPQETVVFAPRPADRLSQRGFALPDPDDDPSIPVPLATYSNEKQRRRTFFLVALAGILLLASGLWFAISHGYAASWMADYSPLLQKKLELFRAEVRDLGGDHTASAPAAQSSAPATAQPHENPGPSTTSAAVPTADTAADVSQQTLPVTQTPHEETARSTPSASGDAPQPVSPPGSVLHVSSATMQANLLSSRVPAYPDKARKMRVEGTVTVEILISRTGVVQRVHVLHGDTQLRMAAVDAVLRWKYKPYLQNGRPVPVITQVNVPFHLPRR